MAAQRNNFNFDQYNLIMKDANMGLKLHLAIQNLKDVVSGLEHFDNPLETEVRPIYLELKNFQKLYKEAAADRAKKAENESERTASIDNSTLPTLGVADMMKMLEQQQRMIAALAAGNHPVAVTAEEGIKELQDGVLHNVDTPEEKKAA